MANPALSGLDTSVALPHIRHIGMADIRAALADGFEDFWAMPSHLLFLGMMYPVIGFVLFRLAFGYDVLPLLFPMIAGFALIGPAAATGLYELSRRREKGLEVSWAHAFAVLRAPAIRSIVALGALLLAFFIGWLYTAQALYQALFGDIPPRSLQEFATQILTTPSGWTLIAVGNLIGFVYAAAVLVLSVVSFPMLVDRPVGVAVAVQTSVRAVLANPLAMIVWGLIVAVGLVIGSAPFLIGLALIMPILGHATWHLYRRVVEW
jgi:uncharacterized membrane protein